MKKQLKTIASVCLVAMLFTTGCKKSEVVDPTKGFSQQIQNIVPQSIVDDLKKRGMPINEGTVPPNIEGIFISNPHTLVVPYGTEDTYAVGYEFSDLLVKFSNQKTDGSMSIDAKNAGTLSSGIGGFISGNGTKFSIFAELNYVSGSVTAKQIRVFSGEITSDGIKDFYTTILIKEKNDPSNTLFPVGKSRIIKDGNGLASKTSTFRLAANDDLLKSESSNN